MNPFKRTLMIIPTLLLLSIGIFLVRSLIPYDSIEVKLEQAGMNKEDANYIIEYNNEKIKAGLHLPLFYLSIGSQNRNGFHLPAVRWNGVKNQYQIWFKNVLYGDLGHSMKDGRPVMQSIGQSLTWTSLIIGISLCIILMITIPASLYSSYRHGKLFDKVYTFLTLLIYSIPSFWLATIILVFFSNDEYGMKIFNSSQIVDTSADFLSGRLPKILPAIVCIVLSDLAYVSMMMRSNILANTHHLYYTTAMSKGLSQWQTLRKHILPNTLIPLVTLITNSLPLAFAGTLVIESIFSIPGMGRLLFSSIYAADWPMVYAIVLFIGFITVVSYLLGDLMVYYLDPKLKTKV